jgi:hypothetical protein
VTISNSAITRNSAGSGGDAGKGGDDNNDVGDGGPGGTGGVGGYGGGIAADKDENGVTPPTVTITNSTIANNGAGQGGLGGQGGFGGPNGGNFGPNGRGGDGGFGGGIGWFVIANVTHTTIAGNTSGNGRIGNPQGTNGIAGGWHHPSGGSAKNTIVANNVAVGFPADANCFSNAGQVADQGGNIVWPMNSGTCVWQFADPLLGALADNGGPTQTMALGEGSPAINNPNATLAGCGTVDQRDLPRPQPAGADCDTGAFEACETLDAPFPDCPVTPPPPGGGGGGGGQVTPVPQVTGQRAAALKRCAKIKNKKKKKKCKRRARRLPV